MHATVHDCVHALILQVIGIECIMKADLRISIKDFHRNRTLRVILYREPFQANRFRVTMNGDKWPKDGRPVSMTLLFASLRKRVVQRLKSPGAVVGPTCTRPRFEGANDS